MRRRFLETLVTSVLVALLAAGCGGGDPPERDAAVTRTPVAATATPTPDVTETPTATATATATATPTPTATATPVTGGAEAGDEEGIRVPVDVLVTPARISASPDRVAAFLPVRFKVRSALGKEVQVVVVRSGEGGGAAGRTTLPAGGSATIDVDGLQPGSLEVLSPDLDPDMTAIVVVKPGG